LHDHTPKERIDFLKNEYGHGGGTWIDGGSWAEPGIGVRLERPGCEDVTLNWNAVSKRISELIQSGRYMTQAELDRVPGYEKLMLARGVKRFFETLPQEERGQSPFAKELDFIYPKQAEWDAIRSFTEDSTEVGACLEKMRYIFEHTPADDRYYDSRKSGFDKLAAFANGTYTLFPDIDKIQNALLLRQARQERQSRQPRQASEASPTSIPMPSTSTALK